MSCYILDLIEALKNDFIKKNTPTRFDSVKCYEELLEKSKINPAISEYITGTSSGVMMVDSYEKLLELSKINPAVADNMTHTQFGLDLIDSYEKFLEISKINAKVAFNFRILNYQRYINLVDSYQQSSQAESLSDLNTSANSQLFLRKAILPNKTELLSQQDKQEQLMIQLDLGCNGTKLSRLLSAIRNLNGKP
ncbi:TPA: hypothetical protein ACG3OK_003178 [Legionella pneumophila]